MRELFVIVRNAFGMAALILKIRRFVAHCKQKYPPGTEKTTEVIGYFLQLLKWNQSRFVIG